MDGRCHKHEDGDRIGGLGLSNVVVYHLIPCRVSFFFPILLPAFYVFLNILKRKPVWNIGKGV